MKRNLKIGNTIYNNIDGIMAADASTSDYVFLVDTSDATAIANNLSNGCTAYVNGQKITGVYQEIASTASEQVLDNTATDITANILSIGDYKCYNMTSLTSLTLPNVLQIAQYSFYGCTNLTTISIPGLTTVGNYSLYNCSAATTFDFLESVKSIGNYGMFNFGAGAFDWDNTSDDSIAVGNYGLSTSNIASISGKWTLTGDHCCADCDQLVTIDVDCDGSDLGTYCFYGSNNVTGITLTNCSGLKNYSLGGNSSTYGLTKVASFDCSLSTITGTVGQYALGYLGYNRTDYATSRLLLDFSASTFTTIDSYAFCGQRYSDIILPTTVKTINGYVFSAGSYLNVYLPGDTCPTLSATTAFSNNTTSKIFINYNCAKAYSTATNWSSLTAYMQPYAPKGSFSAGEVLPDVNSEGYEITWYSDIDLTNQITVMPEEAADLYCKIGDTQVGYELSKISVFNGSVLVSDGTRNYKAGWGVRAGTALTISFFPNDGYSYGYIVTVNDSNITVDGAELPSMDASVSLVGKTYSMTVDSSIEVAAFYWNGSDAPLSSTFADNTWTQIRIGVQSGWALNNWNVGDTKTTEFNGSTYTIRIADIKYGSTDDTLLTEGRYTTTSGGKTHYVFEFVELVGTSAVNSSSVTYEGASGYAVGGWAKSALYSKCYNGTFYEALEDEIKDNLSEIVLEEYAYPGTTTNILTTVSKNRLFAPAYYEYFTTTYSYIPESNTGYTALKQEVFDYYAANTNALRIKYQLNTTSSSYYWLRTPSFGSSSYWLYVSSSGTSGDSSARNSWGVALCFAI